MLIYLNIGFDIVRPTLGKPQKKSFLNGRAIKSGGGKCREIKEKGKRTFLGTFFSNVPTLQKSLSSRGEGGLGLNGPAIKKK